MESDPSSDEEVEVGTILADTAIVFRKRRTCWTKGCLSGRENNVAYYTLLRELLIDDDQETSFQALLASVRPLIEKKDTWMRKGIPAGERHAITLRYLGSGKISSYIYM